MLKRLLSKLYTGHLRRKYAMRSVYGAQQLSAAWIQDYRKKLLPYSEIRAIHKLGFTVSDWLVCGITRESAANYLSSAAYYALHPINGAYSKWIDDKLTLKYLTYGTAADFMPQYYFQIDSDGRILRLPDCPLAESTPDAVCALLQMTRLLAIKKTAASLGEGFLKAEFLGGVYRLNGAEMDKTTFCSRIAALRDYLVMEYLTPHDTLAAIAPGTANTIRYLIARVDEAVVPLVSFIRFGTKSSGFVENYNAGGILCYLDENGCYAGGNLLDTAAQQNTLVHQHPDSGIPLCGKIPLWEELTRQAKVLSDTFPQLKYLGIDFVVTKQNEVKILEVNSLTSLDSLQLREPVFRTALGSYFKSL